MRTLHYLTQSPENIYITFKSWHHRNDIQVLGDRYDFYKVITRDERIADKLFIYETDEDGNDLPADEWRVKDSDGNTLLCGMDNIAADTGTLDMGDYDIEVKRLSECEGDAYLDALEVECDFLYHCDEVRAYIAQQRGEYFVEALKWYDSNVYLVFSEGGGRDVCVGHIEWCDDKDGIYDVLREEFNLCEFSAREVADELDLTDWWGRHADEYEEE